MSLDEHSSTPWNRREWPQLQGIRAADLGEATSLDLSCSRLSPQDVHLLSGLVKTSTRLTRLCLFESSGVTPDGVEELCEAMTQSPSLVEVILSRVSLGLPGALKLSAMLQMRPYVSVLDLADCKLDDDAAEHLAAAVFDNPVLTELNLADNAISCRGAVALADALLSKCALTRLFVQRNQVGDDGASAFVQVIIDGALSTLSLAGNPFEVKTAKRLFDAMPFSPTVTRLDLGRVGGRDGNSYLLALEPYFKRNRSNNLNRNGSLLTLLCRTFKMQTL